MQIVKQIRHYLLSLLLGLYATYNRFSQALKVIDSSSNYRSVYVVAGNFSLDGEMLNIAQYDVEKNEWIKKYRSELSTIESTGVILDVVSYRSNNSPYDKLYVVGLFDTMTSTSQVQFCSVSSWNGYGFEKVGEGLCPRGNSPNALSTKIQVVVVGDDEDLYVGGSFESRVWDGGKFIKIQNAARFHSATSSWLPLSDGAFTCIQAAQTPRVHALAWDSANKLLYIGGNFDSIEGSPISTGLAVWSFEDGLRAFPTAGVLIDNYSNNGGTVLCLEYDRESQSLFVAGNFLFIGDISCSTVAVWNSKSNSWLCLYNAGRGISTVTSMLLHKQSLYVAGWASTSSDWNGRQWQSMYAIATLNVAGYIRETIAPLQPRSIHQRFESYENISKNINEDIDDRKRRRVLSSSSSLSPSLSPVAPPWRPDWRWLEGFSGGNGPIMKIVPGKDKIENCLFIVGAFNNYQAVLLWCNETVKGPNLAAISPTQRIDGLVTSITQINIPPDDYPLPYIPTKPPSSVVVIDSSRMYMMIVSLAVLLGAVIGLVVVRRNQEYVQINNENISLHKTTTANDSFHLTFPLTTLSGGVDNSVDFRACFERAMHARHLPSHESLLIIDPSEVILSKAIGEGSFGRVWSGYWRNSAVAIKEFVFAQSAIVGGSIDRNNIIDEIVGEAGIMAWLRHPKILQIYGCSLTMQAIWIASELCNRGSLRMVLNDRSISLSLMKKLSICIDVADGMLYLHTRTPPIIHRDLKSHNIFIIETATGQFVAKIGDWGSARALALSGAKSMTQGVGTACWLAPEVINNAHFSKDSDVYAFGILLWEVSTRNEVHERLSAAQIISKVAYEELRPIVPRFCPWAELMTACWKQQARLRPGFQKILSDLSFLYSSARASKKIYQLNQLNHNKVVNESIESNVGECGDPESGLMVRTRSLPHIISTDANTSDGGRRQVSNSTPLPVLSSHISPRSHPDTTVSESRAPTDGDWTHDFIDVELPEDNNDKITKLSGLNDARNKQDG